MIYKIPQSNKKFSHPNSGDFFGNIKSSKNITFQFNGYIGLEKRTRLLWDSSTYTDITSTAGDSIKKFAYTNDGKIWVAGSKTLYYIDTSFNLVKDTSTGTPNLNALSGQTATDICSFNSSVGDNYICAVNWTSTLYYLKSGATTWSNMTLDNAYNEIMCVFENLQCLAVAGNNKVQLVTNAFVKDVVLTLPSNTRVVSMAWNNNRLYISSIDLYNDDAIYRDWETH